MKKIKEPIRGGSSVESRSITKVKSSGRSAGALRDGGADKTSTPSVTKKAKATDTTLRDGSVKLQKRSRLK
jgi:hypothetical protein